MNIFFKINDLELLKVRPYLDTVSWKPGLCTTSAKLKKVLYTNLDCDNSTMNNVKANLLSVLYLAEDDKELWLGHAKNIKHEWRFPVEQYQKLSI